MKNFILKLQFAVVMIAACLLISPANAASNPDEANAARTLKVKAYKVDNEKAFKLHFVNIDDNATVRILDAQGRQIYKEVVKNRKNYVRKFKVEVEFLSHCVVEVSNSTQLTREIVIF